MQHPHEASGPADRKKRSRPTTGEKNRAQRAKIEVLEDSIKQRWSRQAPQTPPASRDNRNSTSAQAPLALRDNRNSTARPRRVPDAEWKASQILAQQDGGASFGTAVAAVISPTVASSTSAWSAVATTAGWTDTAESDTGITVTATFRLPEREEDSGAISASPAALMSGRQSNAALPWLESMWSYSWVRLEILGPRPLLSGCPLLPRLTCQASQQIWIFQHSFDRASLRARPGSCQRLL